MVIETKFLLGIFLYPALKVNLANMNFEKPLALGGQVNLSELGRCPKMDKKQRKMVSSQYFGVTVFYSRQIWEVSPCCRHYSRILDRYFGAAPFF